MSFLLWPIFNPILLIASLSNSINPFPSISFNSPEKLRQFLKKFDTSSLEEIIVIFSFISFSPILSLLSFKNACIFFNGPNPIPSFLKSLSSKSFKISPEISSFMILFFASSLIRNFLAKYSDTSSFVELAVIESSSLIVLLKRFFFIYYFFI